MSKCDVTWCESGAEWEWTRTPAQIKKSRVKFKGTVTAMQPTRVVCDVHKPTWREDVYTRIVR